MHLILVFIQYALLEKNVNWPRSSIGNERSRSINHRGHGGHRGINPRYKNVIPIKAFVFYLNFDFFYSFLCGLCVLSGFMF